jgi:hypothetical protein
VATAGTKREQDEMPLFANLEKDEGDMD